MTDKPILFSGPMVRALLAGTKTQTRRTMNPQPELQGNGLYHVHNRAGGVVNVAEKDVGGHAVDYLRIAVGDRLYVREHWRTWEGYDAIAPRDLTPPVGLFCEADRKAGETVVAGKFRQGMHMPRWASRITLTVTDVRVERLQGISEVDALAEGIIQRGMLYGLGGSGWYDPPTSAVAAYRNLWETINGPGAWAANPWVAAYTFTVQMGNIDKAPK